MRVNIVPDFSKLDDNTRAKNMGVAWYRPDEETAYFIFYMVEKNNTLYIIPRYENTTDYNEFMTAIDAKPIFDGFMYTIQKSNDLSSALDVLKKQHMDFNIQSDNGEPLLFQLNFIDSPLYDYEPNNFNDEVEQTLVAMDDVEPGVNEETPDSTDSSEDDGPPVTPFEDLDPNEQKSIVNIITQMHKDDPEAYQGK